MVCLVQDKLAEDSAFIKAQAATKTLTKVMDECQVVCPALCEALAESLSSNCPFLSPSRFKAFGLLGMLVQCCGRLLAATTGQGPQICPSRNVVQRSCYAMPWSRNSQATIINAMQWYAILCNSHATPCKGQAILHSALTAFAWCGQVFGTCALQPSQPLPIRFHGRDSPHCCWHIGLLCTRGPME